MTLDPTIIRAVLPSYWCLRLWPRNGGSYTRCDNPISDLESPEGGTVTVGICKRSHTLWCKLAHFPLYLCIFTWDSRLQAQYDKINHKEQKLHTPTIGAFSQHLPAALCLSNQVQLNVVHFGRKITPPLNCHIWIPLGQLG